MFFSYKKWYIFKNPRWIKIENFDNFYKNMLEDFKEKIWLQVSPENQTNKKENLDKISKIFNIFSKLRENSFPDKLKEQLKIYFYDSTFIKKLYSNPNLLGFNNGVYDLSINSFRNTNPEDFVSLSVGYDYLEYDFVHDQVKQNYSNY